MGSALGPSWWAQWRSTPRLGFELNEAPLRSHLTPSSSTPLTGCAWPTARRAAPLDQQRTLVRVGGVDRLISNPSPQRWIVGRKAAERFRHPVGLDREHRESDVAALIAALGAAHRWTLACRGGVEVTIDARSELHERLLGGVSIAHGASAWATGGLRRRAATSSPAATASAPSSAGKLTPPTNGCPPPPSRSQTAEMSCSRSSAGSQGL